MPELPEVEIMSRNLARWSADQRLTRLEILDPKALKTDPKRAGAADGAAIGPAWRRGKHICVPLDKHTLILHCRMTGKVVRETAPRVHTRARLHLSGGGVVAFVDSRRFGQLWLMPTAEARAWLDAKLGPEPWPERRDAAWWREQLAGLRGPIKPALMRQDRVAGLGNIAAAEICWRAALDPQRRVASLTDAEWGRISRSAPEFLQAVLDTGDEELRYLSEGAEAPEAFCVYDRGGQPCLRPRCGGTVARFTQAGRATYWCPTCQK